MSRRCHTKGSVVRGAAALVAKPCELHQAGLISTPSQVQPVRIIKTMRFMHHQTTFPLSLQGQPELEEAYTLKTHESYIEYV